MIVPEAPGRFFLEFLPAVVEASRAAAAGARDRAPARALGQAGDDPSRRRRGPANAAVAVRVLGVGEWTLRLAGQALQVSPGVAADVALQISLRSEDFTPLVVEPTRRALAASASGSPEANALAADVFSARLGRLDEETVDLLRRQQGRILVRIDDAGSARKVALSPGLAEPSLDSAECFIDCELAALEQLQDKRKTPLDLFYEGQIRISGDAQIALAMAGLFL